MKNVLKYVGVFVLGPRSHTWLFFDRREGSIASQNALCRMHEGIVVRSNPRVCVCVAAIIRAS